MTTSPSPSMTILSQRLKTDVWSLPVVWAAYVGVVALIVAAVALFRTDGIEVSGWEQAARVARWYVGAVGVYLSAVYLPMYVTHGYTRRDFGKQLPLFVVAFSAMYGLLMTIGFAVETVVYRVFDWPQVLTDTRLFEVPSQFGLIFAESMFIGVIWIAAGAMIGAAFYRNKLLGLVLIPVVVAMLGAAEIIGGPGTVQVPFGLFNATPNLVGAGLIAGAVMAAGLALYWVIARDIPVRNRAK